MSAWLSRRKKILGIGLLSFSVVGGAAVLWMYSGGAQSSCAATCVSCDDDTRCADLKCNTKCTCFGCEFDPKKPCCNVCDRHAYCGCGDKVGEPCDCICPGTCQELQPQTQPHLCTCS